MLVSNRYVEGDRSKIHLEGGKSYKQLWSWEEGYLSRLWLRGSTDKGNAGEGEADFRGDGRRW